MRKLSLSEYGPIISDKDVGSQIYNKIKGLLGNDEKVEIDLVEIKSMATFCAKQIFGNLYTDLGPNQFFERINLKNANNDLRVIIKIGIEHSLDEDNSI